MDIIGWLFDWLKTILGYIFFFLPDDPFMPIIQSMAGGEWLSALNWVIPIGTMVGIGGGWLLCVAGYYTYQVILRWVKAVGGS